MKKIIAVIIILALMLPGMIPPAFAANKVKNSIQDVGNKLCPVMGGPVNGKDFVVYEGKRYGLCCPGCDKVFLSNPGKYIVQMEAKEKTSVSTAKVNPDEAKSSEMEKDMEQGSL